VKHFPFGSSTAARTDECQQWKDQSKNIPPAEDSPFAIDGTIIHGILEQYALGEMVPPESIEGHPVENHHIDLANDMWDETSLLLQRNGATQWEPEVQATTADDVGGTLDLVADCSNDTFNFTMLLDYKTGRGIQIDPENNKQILFAAANMLYGSSSATDLIEHNDHFLGVIMQPNQSGEIETREWAFTRERVDAFWKNHQQNIELARRGQGDMNPGSHCKYCPANGLCDATTGNLLRMKQLDPEDLEQLKWGLDMVEEVKETIKQIEAMAYRQMELGQAIPGWKLVRGRAGSTAWDDPEYALKKLKRMLRGCKVDGERAITLVETKKLISPTQAKQLLKKAEVATDWLDEITHRPEPKGLTLAKESDKRPAVLSAEAMQDALNSIA
jgi:hypothetical protein